MRVGDQRLEFIRALRGDIILLVSRTIWSLARLRDSCFCVQPGWFFDHCLASRGDFQEKGEKLWMSEFQPMSDLRAAKPVLEFVPKQNTRDCGGQNRYPTWNLGK